MPGFVLGKQWGAKNILFVWNLSSCRRERSINIITQKYEIITKMGAVKEQWLVSYKPVIEGINLVREGWSQK